MVEKADLSELEAAWALVDELFTARITASRALMRPITLRNPFVFYLGHLPSFSWNTIRATLTPPPPPIDAEFEAIFARGIDPDIEDRSKCHSHPAAPPEWPAWDKVMAYQDRVRGAIRNLASQPNGPSVRVIRLVAEHEVMHVETLYYMLAQTLRPRTPCCKSNETVITAVEGTPVKEAPLPKIEWVAVEGGCVKLGDDSGSTFVWDNEQNGEMVEVLPFRIAKYAVSVGEFVRFVRAGGYRRRALWTAEDWDWVTREGMRHPMSWACDGEGGYVVLTGIGPGWAGEGDVRAVAEVVDWPASVSLAEARAYAAWVGADVPSEAQWMLAAFGAEGGEARGRAEMVMTGVPRDVVEGGVAECGAVGMVGNGWEVTGTVFDRFDGFREMQEYPEYSKDFFDGKHFVLKGASWATHPLVVRPSFRNFYQSRYPYVFSKFRLVAPPAEKSLVEE